MKRFLYFFKWSIISCFIVGIIAFVSFVYYLENSIDEVMTPEKQTVLFNSIDTTKELPESFYTTIDKYYPDYFSQDVWSSVAGQVMGRNGYQCQCRGIYLGPYYIHNWSVFSTLIVSLELEERFSPRKCYAYKMYSADFGRNTEGVEEAARKFYNKSLNELSEDEILELNIIEHGPSFYNPFRNRERLNVAVQHIKSKQSIK